MCYIHQFALFAIAVFGNPYWFIALKLRLWVALKT